MFRRTSPEPETPPIDDKIGGKGRPTPSRKEAEAAARARAKVPRTRKEQVAAQRSARGDTSRRMREAMKTGDDRYLPSRDRGPVRRFIRDFVDSRFSFIELMVPLLVVSMVLGYSGNRSMQNLSNTILFTTLLVIVFDVVMLRFRLRRELARRFPDESPKGAVLYAAMRSLQMKFLRLPKAQVRIGEKLPESYR
ncbi:DUF3043 domain-containing protein [Nocardioides sp. zg-1308]|uniref:DUF3043 domain-containing protein n=1 Tax=Nocardioides renjunii TaxID=3095075 RepID=A0ABU5KFW7_9ACTN|nr:DUF3043 domain-containing protein [Nocardioides sp. S-58]MDZ5663856.1 DUF3043 domain-containing protein [Nocardioides sp. S-58]NPD06715.1 DUF3043 domain-containing protein [Nocardioides sp. zg-1308]